MVHNKSGWKSSSFQTPHQKRSCYRTPSKERLETRNININTKASETQIVLLAEEVNING